jgi:hypothetical protein
MPSKPALLITAQHIRQFKPPVCEPTDGSHLRRLYPNAVLDRQARADLRELALGVLDEEGATLLDRIEASLIYAHVLWSQGIAAGHIRRSFHAWLKEHIDGGDAYLLDEDRDASNTIRGALGLMPRRVPRKASLKAAEARVAA